MSVQFKDYYEVLSVPRAAPQDEIRKAFRALARKFHPDVAKDKKTAEEKFKEINEAYEVLGDPEKRKKYDELGANWKQGSEFRPPPGWQGGRGRPGVGGDAEFQFGGTGFSDFFESFFGGAASGRGARGGFQGVPNEQEFAARGRDVEGDIMVTLEEALHGSVRAVSLQRGGRGAKTETYQVRIPAGVTEGQRMRVAGRGEVGQGGGSSGDLFLRVRLARHPEFEVEGHDLVHDLALAPWEAVLGAQVQVPTLEKPVQIKIPAGTQTGQRLRVRGRGLPQRDGVRGDLLVEVLIELPKSVTDRECELWEQLARESKFNPRD